MLMTMMMMMIIITIEKEEAYYLVPKSILLVNIRVIWKVNTIYFVYLYLYFICHTTITKKIEKEEKKKWRGDLTETIEAYASLGLLEL